MATLAFKGYSSLNGEVLSSQVLVFMTTVDKFEKWMHQKHL